MRSGWLGVWLSVLSLTALAAAPTDFSVRCGDADIPVTRFAAAGATLIVWLPSEFGTLPQELAIAGKLAAQGHEIWMADLYGARFLPVVASSAEEIPASDINQLLRAAASKSKKRLYLLAAGRGAKYALEGAAQWQRGGGRQRPLAGAVLLYPNLYAGPPDPGDDPRYLPIASHTHLRIELLQGDLSPWYWTLDSLTQALAKRGSRVHVQTLPGVRDRFYFREDANASERAMGERLPELLAAAIDASARHDKTRRNKK